MKMKKCALNDRGFLADETLKSSQKSPVFSRSNLFIFGFIATAICFRQIITFFIHATLFGHMMSQIYMYTYIKYTMFLHDEMCFRTQRSFLVCSVIIIFLFRSITTSSQLKKKKYRNIIFHILRNLATRFKSTHVTKNKNKN